MTDAVDRAVSEAESKATESQDQQAQVPARASTTSKAPAKPGKPLSMRQIANRGLMPDHWLKVSEFGLTVGNNRKPLLDELTVEIDMKKVAPCLVVKFGAQPPTYLKSYDGVTCVQGGTWQDALERAQSVDPRASDYRSADIPMKLLEDVGEGKAKIASNGETLGYSVSTTGFAKWEDFWNKLAEQGLEESVVKVKLSWEERKNSAGNVWGVVTYAYVDTIEYREPEEEAA